MKKFAQKQHQSSQKGSSDLTRYKTKFPGSHIHPILKLQRTIGNQAVQRLLNMNTRDTMAGKIAGTRLTKTVLLQREQAATPGGSRIRWGSIRQLAHGMVVRVEVRTGGDIEDITHEYPIDVSGYIEMPPLGLVRADGLSTDQFSDQIQRALISGGFIHSPTVNVTLTQKIVAYGALITYPRVHLRLLSQAGTVESGSGEYPVRGDGTLNLPHVGVISARNRRLDVVESEIESRIRRGYIINGIAHLTRQHLD